MSLSYVTNGLVEKWTDGNGKRWGRNTYQTDVLVKDNRYATIYQWKSGQIDMSGGGTGIHIRQMSLLKMTDGPVEKWADGQVVTGTDGQINR